MQKVFCDTNILMSHSDRIFDTYNKIIISGIVLEELDKHKYYSDPNKQYQARQATRLIEANEDKIEYVIKEGSASLPIYFGRDSNDNRIISVLKDLCFKDDNGIIALSNDLLFRQKCKLLNIPCEKFELEDRNEVYKGIRELTLTEEEYVNLLENPKNNLYNLYPNEYLIINNITKLDQYLLVWNGNYFEEVKVKPISNKYLNKINPLDIYQKAFIHMLQSDNIKIKITDSIYGAGKSYLMIHWALQMIDREKFNKIYFIKSDSPPKGRKEFPAIPGDVEDKCEPLMGVLCDSTNEDNLVDILLRNNKLKIMPIQFVKGRSIRNSIIYINEAQDFTPSEIERILSRLGEGSVALLDGSTKQTDNRYCLHRSGLTVASNNYKNSKNAAQVNMVEDYRSDISKEVGKMDWSD